MEENLDQLVDENNSQFAHHNDIIQKNNKNIYSVREDFGKVQRQHFEMGHINETLEQRIDQLKGQRDLSILLTKAGLQNDLKSQQADAGRNSEKLQVLHNNMEHSWDDKLVVKMRELEDALRQSSEESINQQVQKYLQQVREKNKQIVRLTQQKEEIESKKLQEVNDNELRNLQKEHSALISQYEAIIKQKIDIFTEMINNLKSISDGNVQTIDNEEQIAAKKLAIEVWERDIYQKKRVNMDVQVEIQNVLYDIDAKEKLVLEREQRIIELRKELEEAQRQRAEFEGESAECDEKIATLEH